MADLPITAVANLGQFRTATADLPDDTAIHILARGRLTTDTPAGERIYLDADGLILSPTRFTFSYLDLLVEATDDAHGPDSFAAALTQAHTGGAAEERERIAQAVEQAARDHENSYWTGNNPTDDQPLNTATGMRNAARIARTAP